MGAKLDRTEGNTFLLSVPPVDFPGVLTVGPRVTCKAYSEADRVMIVGETCVLEGSPLIEQTQLNDRYCFDVNTVLRWRVDAAGCAVMTVESEVAVDVDPPLIFRTIPRPVLTKLGTEVMKLALRKVEASFISALMEDYLKWRRDPVYRESRRPPGEKAEVRGHVGSAPGERELAAEPRLH